MGGDEVTVCSPRAIKRHFSDLGWLVRESGEQLIFSSIFPVACNIWRHRLTQSINDSMAGVTTTVLGFFSNGMVPSLLTIDWIHLSQKAKRVFDREEVISALSMINAS